MAESDRRENWLLFEKPACLFFLSIFLVIVGTWKSNLIRLLFYGILIYHEKKENEQIIVY